MNGLEDRESSLINVFALHRRQAKIKKTDWLFKEMSEVSKYHFTLSYELSLPFFFNKILSTLSILKSAVRLYVIAEECN